MNWAFFMTLLYIVTAALCTAALFLHVVEVFARLSR